MAAASSFEFALTILDVQKEKPDGKPIMNGDQVYFTYETGTATSCEYFGLCDVVGHKTGSKFEKWSGQAFDSQHFAQIIKERKPGIKHVVFYIHGFNNQPLDAFESFAGFSAALSVNPEVLAIPVVWACSDSLLNTAKYYHDQSIAATSGIALGRAFAGYFRARSDDLKVHFFAHSMGNRVLDNTISSFADALEARRLPKLVGSIWSVAADVNNDIFERSGHYWCELAKQVCVYHSSSDFMMALSTAANIFGEDRFSGRLGGTGPESPIPPNVFTFDCSSFNRSYDAKGHSYQLAPEILSHVLRMIQTDAVAPWPLAKL